MPSRWLLYKAGRNIFLRWGTNPAQKYLKMMGRGEKRDIDTVTKISEIAGFSPKVLEKMAKDRLLWNKKPNNPIEKAIEQQIRKRDWSEHIRPLGNRGTTRHGHIRPQVPNKTELDEMKMRLLPSDKRSWVNPYNPKSPYYKNRKLY